MLSRKIIIIILFAILIITAGVTSNFFIRARPNLSPEQTSTNSVNVPTIEPVAIQPGKLSTYHSKTYPLSFQYPEGWIVEDTMGGITVTSFKSYAGYSIGTVPEGGFQIDLISYEKSTKSLDVWCRTPIEQDKFNGDMNLVVSTSTEVFTRHGNIVSFDFTSQRDQTYNARVACIEDNDTYIAIDGYPLTASQLPLLNVIVNSVKADHDGRKF